jgi:hypothetical protein
MYVCRRIYSWWSYLWRSQIKYFTTKPWYIILPVIYCTLDWEYIVVGNESGTGTEFPKHGLRSLLLMKTVIFDLHCQNLWNIGNVQHLKARLCRK